MSVIGGLSADSSEGSAPHYEVFVALKGLRNLSEENRDKVNQRQRQDTTERPLHFAHCPVCRGEVGEGRDQIRRTSSKAFVPEPGTKVTSYHRSSSAQHNLPEASRVPGAWLGSAGDAERC